jgi:hypothetical protein
MDVKTGKGQEELLLVTGCGCLPSGEDKAEVEGI